MEGDNERGTELFVVGLYADYEEGQPHCHAKVASSIDLSRLRRARC